MAGMWKMPKIRGQQRHNEIRGETESNHPKLSRKHPCKLCVCLFVRKDVACLEISVVDVLLGLSPHGHFVEEAQNF